jgi:hypothetical protein
MTPHIENKLNVRQLIRSFARVDECFDGGIGGLPDKAISPVFRSLNAKLEFLLSFPLEENILHIVQQHEPLTVEQLRRIVKILPETETNGSADQTVLRENLRDKLYEFLLRMDHCTHEQLQSRGIVLPPLLNLSLMQVQQLVVFMISECLEQHGSTRVEEHAGE